MPSRNTLTETLKNDVLLATLISFSPVMLTHKINQHIRHVAYMHNVLHSKDDHILPFKVTSHLI